MANFTTPTPLPLLISCKLSFPITCLKIPSLPTFALKTRNKIFMWHLNARSSSSQKLSFVLRLLSSVGACTFRTITSRQGPLSVIYDILSLIDSADKIPLRTTVDTGPLSYYRWKCLPRCLAISRKSPSRLLDLSQLYSWNLRSGRGVSNLFFFR